MVTIKKSSLIWAAFLFLLGCAVKKNGTSPGAYDPVDPAGTVFSRSGSMDSHATGQACLNCHRPGGGSELSFSLAGSLYESDQMTALPEGSIQLYTKSEGRGRRLRTLAVDQKGNFYTTAPIDFTDSLYLTVTNSTGVARHKPVALTDGDCNRCHGPETERVWLE